MIKMNHKLCDIEDKGKLEMVIQRIDDLLADPKDQVLLIGIDGKSASGKSTLANALYEHYDCNLFHMDDFFLQDYQRTKLRLAEPGGNVDYERFQEEVLLPLTQKKDVNYRIFSCKERAITQEKLIRYKRLNLIEGSYSQHPYFHDPYQLKLFLDIDEQSQIERIRTRNGEEMLKMFQNLWIPMENRYIHEFHIRENADISM